MSYARLIEGVSDVYVYAHCDDYYVCQWCSMHNRDDDDFICASPDTMAAHLSVHKSRGDLVPQHAIDELLAEKPIEVSEDHMYECDVSMRREAAEIPEPEVEAILEVKIKGVPYKLGFKMQDSKSKEHICNRLDGLAKSLRISIMDKIDD